MKLPAASARSGDVDLEERAVHALRRRLVRAVVADLRHGLSGECVSEFVGDRELLPDQVGAVGVHDPVLRVPEHEAGQPVLRDAVVQSLGEQRTTGGVERHRAVLQISDFEVRQETDPSGDDRGAHRIADGTVAKRSMQDLGGDEADGEDEHEAEDAETGEQREAPPSEGDHRVCHGPHVR